MNAKQILADIAKLEPFYESEYDGRMEEWCFFCGEYHDHKIGKKHEEDCLWVAANKIDPDQIELVDIEKVFKTVSVQYPTSLTRYTFMTDEACKVGDKAVVFTQGRWSVVTIVEVHDEPQLDGDYDYTWLVQVVDRTNYDRHVKEDGEGYPSVGERL